MVRIIKRFFLFILPVLVCISCAPKKEAENDWNKMGLKGNVRILKMEHYFTDFKFGTQVARAQDANLHPDLPEEYFIFNKDGNIIVEFKQSSEYEKKTVKTYDNIGNLIHEDILKIENGAYEKYYIRYVNTYDIHDNLIVIDKYQGDSILEKTITSFNNEGEKLIRNTYYGDGVHKNRYEYQYNFFGYLTEHKIPWYSYIRAYNKYGQQVRRTNNDGSKSITEYDHIGNVINFISPGENNNCYHSTNLYTYDSLNNLVIHKNYTKYDRRDKFESGGGTVRTRKISYFNDSKNIEDPEYTNGIKSDRQILIPAGWKVVSIPNVGSIAIPPDMEIRDDRSLISKKSSDFRESVAVNKNIEIEKPLLLIQPKGINDQTKNASENYARIIINLTKGKRGDFPTNDSELNYTDLSELNEIRKEQTTFFVKKFGKEIVNWSSSRNLKINGFNVVELNYIRAKVSTENTRFNRNIFGPPDYSYSTKQVYNSIVKVSDYTVFNDNKMITIVISYMSDDMWDIYTNKTNPKLDYLINTLDIEM